MSDSDIDDCFSALSARLRRRIDRAFDTSVEQYNKREEEPERKKRKLNANDSPTRNDPILAGGFLIDDAAASGGFLTEDTTPGGFITDDSNNGGFMPESSSTADEHSPKDAGHTTNQMPLSLIPSALQLLDLQPDDEDVLSVFRNAATGWENNHASRDGQDDDAVLLVSRKDWRAVCAALLDTGTAEGEAQDVDDEDGGDTGIEGNEGEDQASGDEYVGSANESESEEDMGSDDEYMEGGFVRTRSRRQGSATPRKSKKRRNSASSSISASESGEDDDFTRRTKRITPRQKSESRRVFGLFFPDVPDADLDKKRVMIKDIARVATLLKEKISTEEIVEMLEAFSTSPDKSMSLKDFEQMMVSAKLA